MKHYSCIQDYVKSLGYTLNPTVKLFFRTQYKYDQAIPPEWFTGHSVTTFIAWLNFMYPTLAAPHDPQTNRVPMMPFRFSPDENKFYLPK